jgi:ACS family hexuronate transporter-like MFS transporter
VGAIPAPPIVAWILLRYGWPRAFVAIGAVGLIWLLLWWPTYRTPQAATAEFEAPLISLRVLVRTGVVLAFTLSKIFLDPVWYFYIFWFVDFVRSGRRRQFPGRRTLRLAAAARRVRDGGP